MCRLKSHCLCSHPWVPFGTVLQYHLFSLRARWPCMISVHCSVFPRIYVLASTVQFNFFFLIQAFLFLLHLKMPLKALLEGCSGHTPCIQCHGKKKAFHKFHLGRLPCCLCGWQQPLEIHREKMNYSTSREHYILWNPIISTYAPSSVVPGFSKDSMPLQSWSTIKLLGRLFSERSRQEKGFPSICSEWLVLPWLCHAWAGLHCRLLPAVRLPRLCFAALWVCALSHTYFWAFNQRPPSHWNFSWSASSLPWLHVSASSDCSLRQGYTSQPDQLQGTDKFGTDRMAGWPWPPASIRWAMGWVWAVSGLMWAVSWNQDTASFAEAGNWYSAGTEKINTSHLQRVHVSATHFLEQP